MSREMTAEGLREDKLTVKSSFSARKLKKNRSKDRKERRNLAAAPRRLLEAAGYKKSSPSRSGQYERYR